MLQHIPEFNLVLWMNCIYIHHILSIHLLMGIWIFFFYFLALINSANMKTSIYASVQILLLILLDNIPMSGIAGSYGDSVFNILKNCQTHWLL